MQPAILRVTLASTKNTKTKTKLQQSNTVIPVVYVSGKAYVPTSVPVKPDYGFKKSTAECTPSLRILSLKENYVSTSPDVASVPSPFGILSPGHNIPQPQSPLVVVVNSLEKETSLSALTSAIAESISKMVLETSTTISKASIALSDAVMRDTELMQRDNDSNLSAISNQMNTLATNEVSSIMNMVNDESSVIHDAVSPISQQTMDLQREATVGLGQQLDKDSDDMVRQIMNATLKSDV